MPTNAEPTLIDTSAALALVDRKHEFHEQALDRLRGRRLGLAGHATFETFSVLTRLPPPRRLSAASAQRLIKSNFPVPAFLGPERSATLLQRFVDGGLSGGAVYDALVAAAAEQHRLLLVSCDRRAAPTYRALGARFELLG